MQVILREHNGWSALGPAIQTMIRSGISLEAGQEMFLRAYVKAALELTEGNVAAAGRAIRVHRNTIYRYAARK